LTPIRDQNHEECVLQKLEDEINAFREMLPRLDKRRAELNAFVSVLKCFLVGYIIRCTGIAR